MAKKNRNEIRKIVKETRPGVNPQAEKSIVDKAKRHGWKESTIREKTHKIDDAVKHNNKGGFSEDVWR